jgi:hypothetical protein
VIQRPVVLVLGAGASKPYGFPVARELLTGIRKSLSTEQAFRVRLLGSDYSETEIGNLHSALMGSPVGSVDEFLEIPAHARLIKVGKAAIAAYLLPREFARNLLPDAQEDDWYEYLFRRMKDGASSLNEFLQNGVSFVTFNYDRSLEQFMFHALCSTYGATPTQVADAWKRARTQIVHVYGSFGPLPDLGGTISYGVEPNFTGLLLRQAADSIHIVGESDAQAGITAAQDVLMRCERVCFLGFGYRTANVQRLELKTTLRKEARVFGSVYKMMRGEIEDLRRLFAAEAAQEYPLLLSDPAHDALRALRDLPVLSPYDLEHFSYLGDV